MTERPFNPNSQQEAAITHFDGPALVLAGPGCGKTFVITSRIVHLIREKGVLPWQIAVFTFTRAAAFEMQKRCISICKEASLAAFGTFHSVFYQILCSDSRYAQASILSAGEKNQILKQLLYTRYSDISTINQKIPIFHHAISYYLNTNKIPQEALLLPDFETLFESYKRECTMRRKLDFDLILSECLRLLEHDCALRFKWQTRFDHLLVDEFQDTNEVQLKILRILAERNRNLFVVGDDDQSIYGFRGADSSVMFRFLKIYPDARKLPLFENYRCARQILEASISLIAHNRARFDKNLRAHRTDRGEVSYLSYEDEDKELRGLLWQVKEKVEGRTGEIAVLCRTARLFPKLQLAFAKEQILCVVKSETRSFWEEEAVRDIITYMRFVFCGRRRKDLLPVLNKPQRFLGSIFFEEEYVDFAVLTERYMSAWKRQAQTEGRMPDKDNELLAKIRRLQTDMQYLETLDSYGCICYILHVIGYGKWFLADKREYEREATRELWEELKHMAKCYPNVREWISLIDAMQLHKAVEKRMPGLPGDKPVMQGKRQDGSIYLMTYHGAKGLEFSHVFLPFVNEHVVPHKKAKTSEALEEERRMFYVAMTRAKDSLTISCVEGKQTVPSPFLEEIRKEKDGLGNSSNLN